MRVMLHPFDQKTYSKITVAILLVSAIVLFGNSDAQARRRHHHRRRSHKAVINEPKLYERVGGSKGVSIMVDEWMRNSFADQRLQAVFGEITKKPDQTPKLRKALTEQICELADGPCASKTEYAPVATMIKSEEVQFLAYAEDLFKAMQKMNIDEREKNEMLGRLGELRTEQLSQNQDDSDDDDSTSP